MSDTIPHFLSKSGAAKAVRIDRQTLEENFIRPKRVTVYRFGPRGYRIDLNELLEAMKAYQQELADSEGDDSEGDDSDTSQPPTIIRSDQCSRDTLGRSTG